MTNDQKIFLDHGGLGILKCYCDGIFRFNCSGEKILNGLENWIERLEEK